MGKWKPTVEQKLKYYVRYYAKNRVKLLLKQKLEDDIKRAAKICQYCKRRGLPKHKVLYCSQECTKLGELKVRREGDAIKNGPRPEKGRGSIYDTPPESIGVTCKHIKKIARGLCYKCLHIYYKKVNPELTMRNKDQDHARNLRKYDISVNQYMKILEDQNGVCAICKYTPKEGGRRLAVDHDHKTGRVRGLLCWKCNTGIGGFRDNVEYLSQAAIYLTREFDGREVEV